MIRAAGEQLEEAADAVAEDESVGALGAPVFEREVVGTRSAFAGAPSLADQNVHRTDVA
jgi:hypothetical protein